GEFLFSGIYYVFAEDGANISVEFIDGDETSGFNSCEEDQSCDFVKWAGYTYLGTIAVYDEGTYEVNFTGDGDVMIREMFIDVGGIMTAAGGMGGICCSFCVLGLGIIFIFTLKDNKVQQGVMMVQQSDGTFQQVGGMAAPVQGAPTVAGGVHPAYATQQPIIQQPAQQGGILPPGGQQPPPY
ncbi:MAG: hypothetical protein QF885_07805, partial [Candidatus Thalassarchaeaceae archaeon]|nr:hypothetical protein [Candidatus Thalassarchaeaceae archaeon]